MSNVSYGLFCPLAMACEVIEPRWTLLILLEMAGGATRFNEIRRCVGGISPTLLSKRLTELEKHGLVERVEDSSKGTVYYVRTDKAVELDPVLRMLSDWAYRHVEADVALNDLKPDYLMWNVRRKLDASALPARRTVVRFHFEDCKGGEYTYWLIARPGTDVELCITDPHFEVDLFIEGTSKALASVWMGYSALKTEIAEDRISLIGDALLIKTIDRWLIKSRHAYRH